VSRRSGSVAGDLGHTMVTDRQIRLLRRKLEEGKTIQAAAAAADLSERSAHRWKHGVLPSMAKKPRTWRTRQDPFAQVWDGEIVPLLRADEGCILQATELVQMLRERHGESYHQGQVRTLQRRISEWRALYAAGKEVFFEQEHIPGREAAIDFTNCSELGITIAGQLFAHLFFELVLSFSKWRWVCLAFTETFEALVHGIQGALWALGGVPRVIRSDNLSAATRQLPGGGRELNRRFAGVLEHYGLQSTRIEPGQSHQNGVVEKAHDTLKSKIEQALILRASRDFDSPEQYEMFVLGVVTQLNAKGSERLAQERGYLQPLPTSQVPEYTTYRATVRSWSTIHFAKRTYSVPSRLIGREVEVRQHADKIEVLYNDKVTEVMPRLRGDRWYRIDYRHIIWSLVRKPGAFARYRHREELFPSLVFRKAYDTMVKARGERADVEYVRILHLAASTFEADVEAAIAVLLEQGMQLDYMAVKTLVAPQKTEVPVVHIPSPDLAPYDQLLSYAGGER
jgi:hypothetical protein